MLWKVLAEVSKNNKLFFLANSSPSAVETFLLLFLYLFYQNFYLSSKSLLFPTKIKTI